MSTKKTNPKDAIGVTKTPFGRIPSRVMAELALALLEGACKYGGFNWRVAGVRASVYFDATFRHLALWWEGQDIDPDSGLNHITKAIASLTVLRDSMIEGNWNDDRPPASADQEWMASMNLKTKEILAKYPNPLPAHTEIDQAPNKPISTTAEIDPKTGNLLSAQGGFRVGDKVISTKYWDGPMEVYEFHKQPKGNKYEYIAFCMHPHHREGAFEIDDLLPYSIAPSCKEGK